MNCEICGTKLNMYNKTERCHAHMPHELILKAIPKVSCATWIKKEIGADHNYGDPNRHSVAGLMEPGNTTYGDFAFSFHEVGRNDKDGNFKPFRKENENDEKEG